MKRIVLVDDNETLIETLKDFIMLYNDANCVTFSNPLDALSYIPNNDVDILITDYQMPGMHGFELAQQLIKKNVTTRIILYSGYDEESLKNLQKKYGLEGKIEIAIKGDLEFVKHLVN